MQIFDEKINHLNPENVVVLSMQILEIRKDKAFSGIERLSKTWLTKSAFHYGGRSPWKVDFSFTRSIFSFLVSCARPNIQKYVATKIILPSSLVCKLLQVFHTQCSYSETETALCVCVFFFESKCCFVYGNDIENAL